MADKKLKKSKDKKICGVCGGIAEYFGMDPTVVRVIWLILVLCAGTGLIAYIIAALLMPKAE
jgi:phage shock protein PspC (stress-responsive transcriptional regulator)